MDYKFFKWRVSRKEEGMRLLQFLREKCPEAPSIKAIKRAIDSKLCIVNGRIEIFSSYRLAENDTVWLKEVAFEIRKNLTKIPILYEDRDLLVINKPAGIISDHRIIKRSRSNPQEALELVHRLDKETSGLLILAKTSEAKEKMIAFFKARSVRKLYLAIVDRVIRKDEGKIDGFLGKKYSYQGQTVYGSVDEKKGVRAITFWRCLSRGRTTSVVCCEPFTGRTHQLRVHMSEMGHPILGDVQYGKRFICPFKPPRNLLHAYSITFMQPSTGKELKIIAPPAPRGPRFP
jgi:RluA family pseudouridine synthase